MRNYFGGKVWILQFQSWFGPNSLNNLLRDMSTCKMKIKNHIYIDEQKLLSQIKKNQKQQNNRLQEIYNLYSKAFKDNCGVI